MIDDKAMEEEDEEELDDAVNIDPGIYMENFKVPVYHFHT